jgi:hypothetical protein
MNDRNVFYWKDKNGLKEYYIIYLFLLDYLLPTESQRLSNFFSIGRRGGGQMPMTGGILK